MIALKSLLRILVVSSIAVFTGDAPAASVTPVGYANDFTTQPPAADWATLSRAGAAADAYDTDADVNANITASGVTAQTTSNGNDPATQLATATWSSTGLYLQTRPTGNRYTALMGKFVNNTGTNATQISLSYLLTIAGTVSAEDSGLGTRVYYSLSGLANSWSNLAALNTTATSGSSTVSTNLAGNWTNGGSLYLLWADDNGTAGTDVACQIDNFALLVTAGSPPTLSCTVSAPANNAVLSSATTITAAATVAYGTAPYTVQFFTNSGAGNTVFGLAGSSATAPYELSQGNLAAGNYNIYAVVTDSAGTPASSASLTNSFLVADPITFTLATPNDGATFDNTTPVTGTATVSGGTAPHSVQFYLDNVTNGAPVTSEPYSRTFGALPVGDHTIKATVRDAKGWTSNSLVSTIHITGPLAVTLTPTNGTAYNYGQALILTAVAGGGTAPYAVSFYSNDQEAGSLSAPPFTTNLGLLPVGSYTCYVHVTDTSLPTAQQADSSTNVIRIVANPLTATLTAPSSGQNVGTNVNFAINVSASVAAPVTVSRVDFYYDGVLLGSDPTAPYSLIISNRVLGSHTVYAVATDSLGRTKSTTNTMNFIVDPLANDNFANRLALVGPVTGVTGSNVGATTESGEPTGSGFTTWGTTLWWSWVAPATGRAVINTTGSSFNIGQGVYTGTSVNALTQIAFAGNAFGGTVNQVTFNAQQGTEYQIQIAGMRAGGGGGGGFSSGSIVFSVQMPPTVTITSPTNNSSFLAGSNIFITAMATSVLGAVKQVDFYAVSSATATLLGTVTNAPYNFLVTNTLLGTNSLYAVVTDAAGQTATSAGVTIVVLNTGVTLVAPADGTTYGTTNPITVTAVGYLPSGSITNVEFFVDGQKFSEDSTVPFSVRWTNVVGGSHRLTAVGVSDTGDSFNSQPVNIAVSQTLLASNSVWKYLDTGVDQGTNWIASNFDDSSWASGPAPLGFSDSNGRFPLTTNSFGPDANNKYPTTYYRQTVVITNLSKYATFTLNIQRDDGAIVYLNGAEAGRFNMPSGPIGYTNYAAANASDDGATTFSISLNPALLREGANAFAVEIHQDVGTSSDIWFVMELLGVPPIIRNLFPTVALTSPTNTQYFLAPSIIALEATASDADGTVTKVEFFADTVKVGEDTTSPYSASWPNAPIGPHALTAVATDDQGGAQSSAPINIVVYDATGTPFVAVTAPAGGTVVEGPTNLLVTAYASALSGVTNVEFLANGAVVGDDATSPYSILWNAPFGPSALTAVVADSNGRRGTSAVVNVTITIPPTNTTPPHIFTQFPLEGSTITNLTTIQVVFTERVIGVDASDLLVNDVPATNVVGGGSNYLFSIAQPPYGPVRVRFVSGHGITDVGWPTNLVFYENDPEASWNYDLIDKTPPSVVAKFPAAGATLTNLTQIAVTFSEAVSGVDAGDLLVNGTPAYAVSGAGKSHTFSISQPASGTVNVSWATNHGIADLALAPNAFNRTGAGATWTYTLDARTVLVQSNSYWLFVKGTSEASDPTNAWRQLGFDDSGWSNAPAPFFYGDPYSNGLPAYTLLSDMRSNYTTIYLRKKFVVPNATVVTNLYLYAQSDDGFVAYINGVEAYRYNVPGTNGVDLPYNSNASTTAPEPAQTGAAYATYTLSNPRNYLVTGTNILAIQALNESLTSSSDFGFNAQLFTYQSDTEAVAPRVVREEPAAGYVLALTSIAVSFNEPVTNVDAGDLLVNGVPATGLVASTNNTFIFSFPQPAYGPVAITWAPNHGLVDLDIVAKPFDATAPGAIWQYVLLNANSPYILATVPAEDTTVNHLTQIAVIFSEPVSGVDASDLLVNGVPATSVAGSDYDFVFTFQQPAYGPVLITWAASHGIHDLSEPPIDFDPSWPDHTWTYSLADQTPPAIASQNPPAGAVILNLTQITVIFTEPVAGVNARDLLINGRPASGVTGINGTYTFTFAQPNDSMINVTWAANHGIRDLAAIPNAFNATGSGATWSYVTIDNLAPKVALFSPPPFSTARSLRHLTVTFDEAVAGVSAGDLLLNNVPAQQVSGTGAGPYEFTFAQPATGEVQVAWAPGHGIHDLATPANAFAGGAWAYVLDPGIASDFAVKHVILISLDGAGAYYIENYMNSAPDLYPNFVRLLAGGAGTLNARCDYDISVTLPNHSSMFTGRPVLQPAGWPNTTHHGLTIDSDNGTTIHDPRTGNPNVPYKSSVFDVVHDAGFSTAFLCSKQSLTLLSRSWDASHGAADPIGLDNGSNKIDYVYFSSTTPGSYGPSSLVADELVKRMETNVLWNFTFMHYDDGDANGHASGWGSVAYSNGLMNADLQIGRVLNAVGTNAAFSNNTIVIITADHGGSGTGHFDPTVLNTYRVPLFVWGAGIPAGVDLYSLLGNRADPGMTRVSYSETSVLQPLRDGDVGNLAATLLGLPPIPGSSIIPFLGPAPVPLAIRESAGALSVSWPENGVEYDLQVTGNLGTAADWQTVTDGITTVGTNKVYVVTPSPNPPARFFRLQKQ